MTGDQQCNLNLEFEFPNYQEMVEFIIQKMITGDTKQNYVFHCNYNVKLYFVEEKFQSEVLKVINRINVN